jgi:FtsH-binding integral membrane protein
MEMNEYNHKSAVEVLGRAGSAVDQGLRSYLIKVFNYMWLSLLVTGGTAYLFANTSLINLLYNIDMQAQTVSMSAIGWIVTFAPFALIFAFNYVVQNKSMSAVHTVFWLFSVLFGASMASIFLLYTASSMTRVFLITACTFGAMSIYGYTTKRDLSGIGSFLLMGLFGVIIASIVNIWLKSSGLYYAMSYISVLIFVGLTAYDMQNIKALYYGQDSEDTRSRKAIMGALSLYLDFINLFMALLRIMGDRR